MLFLHWYDNLFLGICYVRRLKAVTIELENLECISILSVNVGNSNRENVLGATNVDYDFNTMQILRFSEEPGFFLKL